MELEIQISPSDYRAGLYLHMRPRPLFKWLGLALIALALLTVAGVFWKWTAERDGAISLLGMIAAALSLLAYFFVWVPWWANRIYRQQKTLHKPFTLTVSDQGLRAKSDYGESFLGWDMFHKWKEGKSLFLVYHSDVMYYMVPKQYFVSPEEVDRFRSMLGEKLGGPKP